MGCGESIINIASGGIADPLGINPLAESGGAVNSGDPLLNESLRALSVYRAVAPKQLEVMNEFNPQFAASYGNTLSSLYAGALPVYENQIAPAISRVTQQGQQAQRAGDLADFQMLGPQYTAALLAANPQQGALLDEMNRQALAELQSGGNLTPDQQRIAQQQSRAAFSARGLAGSNGGIADELLRQFQLGEQLKAQRRGFAGNMLGYNQAVVGDPFLATTGRASQVAGLSGQVFGQGGQMYQQTGANTYNPISDAYTTMFRNQDIDLAKDSANKQLIGSIVGGALGAAGSIGGAAI